MENRFDDLTKALAEGIPRRQALRRLASLFGGALLGSLALASTGRADGNQCPPGTCKVKGECVDACTLAGAPCGIGCCCPGLVCNGSTCESLPGSGKGGSA
jgi:hypothetical protein